MRSPLFVSNHESVLVALAARGYEVHVAFEQTEGVVEDQLAPIERLVTAHPAISFGPAAELGSLRSRVTGRLRGAVDYLRYLGPEYRAAYALRARAAHYAPPGFPAAAGMLATRPLARAKAAASITRLTRRTAFDRPLAAYLRAKRPDAIVLSPLIHFGSPQPDYVRVARRLGIPSALVTFSWDNFTNKGLMHEVPDLVTVWNEVQADEARVHHGVPADRIAVTGAPAYDHWFTWGPATTRTRFTARAGLPADRPYLLYACSSSFIAPDEPAWVVEWLARLRAASGPLRDVAVLVRPHPLNASVWRDVRLEDAVVFPTVVGARAADARTDYFDSIHHCAAVVGLNTSALVEAAILRRASFTLTATPFRDTQVGTLHFHHLRRDRGGPLRVAANFAEHHAQLGEELARPDARPELDAFVASFVRPAGRATSAGSLAADAIERLAVAGLRA